MLAIADLELDPAAYRVTRARSAIELGTREFALLELLLRHPGRVFTRAEIVAEIWRDAPPRTANIVDAYIYRLRAKIDDHSPVKLIQTVRGEGYRVALQSD